jgi:hypothetical protein
MQQLSPDVPAGHLAAEPLTPVPLAHMKMLAARAQCSHMQIVHQLQKKGMQM